MAEIGARKLAAIERTASETKMRVKVKAREFERAAKVADDVKKEEVRATEGFRQHVENAERLARDNLSFFRDNGFLAFGSHFDSFLAAVNLSRRATDSYADGPLTLPCELSEKDRAFLANSLMRAMGEPEKLADYFEIPGYRLKYADGFGELTTARIRLNLEKCGLFKDGQLRISMLESRLGIGKQT